MGLSFFFSRVVGERNFEKQVIRREARRRVPADVSHELGSCDRLNGTCPTRACAIHAFLRGAYAPVYMPPLFVSPSLSLSLVVYTGGSSQISSTKDYIRKCILAPLSLLFTLRKGRRRGFLLREKYISFFSFFFYYCDAGLGLDKGGRKVGRADSIDRSREGDRGNPFRNDFRKLLADFKFQRLVNFKRIKFYFS